MIQYVFFAFFCLSGGIIGILIANYLYDDIIPRLFTLIVIYFLFISIGLISQQFFFEEEIELERNEFECKNICESQGLEFVDYIAEECLCREPKFTLVNGGAT